MANLHFVTGVYMQAPSYDILRRDALGKAIWIEAVADLDAAKAGIRFPAGYVVFHRGTASIVANFCFKPNEFPSLTCVAVDQESLSSG